jgi:hypothetical protein
MYRSPKAGAVVDIDIRRWDVRITVELVIEEASKEVWKLWLIDVGCKIYNCTRIPSFWKITYKYCPETLRTKI